MILQKQLTKIAIETTDLKVAMSETHKLFKASSRLIFRPSGFFLALYPNGALMLGHQSWPRFCRGLWLMLNTGSKD